jgi:hypothetical protein
VDFRVETCGSDGVSLPPLPPRVAPLNAEAVHPDNDNDVADDLNYHSNREFEFVATAKEDSVLSNGDSGSPGYLGVVPSGTQQDCYGILSRLGGDGERGAVFIRLSADVESWIRRAAASRGLPIDHPPPPI